MGTTLHLQITGSEKKKTKSRENITHTCKVFLIFKEMLLISYT